MTALLIAQESSSGIAVGGKDGRMKKLKVRINLRAHEVVVAGKSVRLPPKECGVLRMLVRARGALVRRQDMIKEVWGDGYYIEPVSLSITIMRLRRKIGEHAIVTIPGYGYCLGRM